MASRNGSPVLVGLFSLACLCAVACGGGGHSSQKVDVARIDSVLTETQSSDHFNYRYTPGDSVDPKFNEAFYDWISAQLGIALPQKIDYYKFLNDAQKQQLTGMPGNGNADLATESVYTIWGTDNHETTHLFTSTIGVPTPFFNEGMAVANQADPLDKVYIPYWGAYTPHHWAKQYLQDGTLPALSGFLDEATFVAYDANASYPIAGSFVRYLIDKYGMEAVLKMFSGATFYDTPATTTARFESAFGVAFTDAEQDWHAFLLKYKDPH